MASERDHRAAILAAVWAAVAALGVRRALELVREAMSAVDNADWSGPGGR